MGLNVPFATIVRGGPIVFAGPFSDLQPLCKVKQLLAWFYVLDHSCSFNVLEIMYFLSSF